MGEGASRLGQHLVSDSGPLIFLARLGRLNLLQDFADTVWIPPSVFQEVVTAAPDAPGAEVVRQTLWLKQRSPLIRRARNLDAGESEVLDLTLELPNAMAILDDGRARRVAEDESMGCIGTVGLLVRAREHGLIQRLRPVLEELLTYGFWMDDRLIETALANVGE